MATAAAAAVRPQALMQATTLVHEAQLQRGALDRTGQAGSASDGYLKHYRDAIRSSLDLFAVPLPARTRKAGGAAHPSAMAVAAAAAARAHNVPDVASRAYRRGVTAYESGLSADAARYFLAGLSADPSNPKMRRGYERALAQLKHAGRRNWTAALPRDQLTHAGDALPQLARRAAGGGRTEHAASAPELRGADCSAHTPALPPIAGAQPASSHARAAGSLYTARDGAPLDGESAHFAELWRRSRVAALTRDANEATQLRHTLARRHLQLHFIFSFYARGGDPEADAFADADVDDAVAAVSTRLPRAAAFGALSPPSPAASHGGFTPRALPDEGAAASGAPSPFPSPRVSAEPVPPNDEADAPAAAPAERSDVPISLGRALLLDAPQQGASPLGSARVPPAPPVRDDGAAARAPLRVNRAALRAFARTCGLLNKRLTLPDLAVLARRAAREESDSAAEWDSDSDETRNGGRGRARPRPSRRPASAARGLFAPTAAVAHGQLAPVAASEPASPSAARRAAAREPGLSEAQWLSLIVRAAAKRAPRGAALCDAVNATLVERVLPRARSADPAPVRQRLIEDEPIRRLLAQFEPKLAHAFVAGATHADGAAPRGHPLFPAPRAGKPPSRLERSRIAHGRFCALLAAARVAQLATPPLSRADLNAAFALSLAPSHGRAALDGAAAADAPFAQLAKARGAELSYGPWKEALVRLAGMLDADAPLADGLHILLGALTGEQRSAGETNILSNLAALREGHKATAILRVLEHRAPPADAGRACASAACDAAA
ncbi:hypothetical protein KFE25_013929 [Diacronema lutheri]|uniref:Uncharacterized protein n=1 Tax=Diacronema lutheri TaxID=2081491 RepID=A0A8J5XFE4_DIALT|nr:hypothetical protein KFE25_013929 [Diacronema lutheri]